MFPRTFASQKEFDAYTSCVSNLKVGDKIEANSVYGPVKGFFIYKEAASFSLSPGWVILIGTEEPDETVRQLFHRASIGEKKKYISPAKKDCPKIRIGQTKLFWLPCDSRILKIVKYNAVQEEKEKKEKAKAAKSIRISRLHEE